MLRAAQCGLDIAPSARRMSDVSYGRRLSRPLIDTERRRASDDVERPTRGRGSGPYPFAGH